MTWVRGPVGPKSKRGARTSRRYAPSSTPTSTLRYVLPDLNRLTTLASPSLRPLQRSRGCEGRSSDGHLPRQLACTYAIAWISPPRAGTARGARF